MKMIIRADDVGFTDVCNIGTFETFDKGLSTSADVMLDCPGTEDALRRLRNYPWISVGWHGHMWGSPVLGKARGARRRIRRPLPHRPAHGSGRGF